MTSGIRLFLIRHGNTFESHETPVQVGLQTDMPLTDKGKEQAKEAGRYFVRHQITPKAIYAGQLKRQVEAAKLFSDECKTASKIYFNEPALDEVDYGQWEGLTAEQIQENWSDEYQKWNQEAIWPNNVFIGALEDKLNQIEAWIAQLKNEYRAGETVVGFTSNGIIRFFYSFLQNEWQDKVDKKAIDDLKVKTGHLCELEVLPTQIIVKQWNFNPKNG